MQALIWIGAAVTLVGVGCLAWCGVAAAKAKSEGLDEAALRARLQKVVMVNLIGMGVSGLGLMMVIAGLFLS